ncbi:MAG TPA: hypothetical protein VE467_00390 [Chryseolinea sp.]|nr:hypothetical protein [Chryseolinea sp.]
MRINYKLYILGLIIIVVLTVIANYYKTPSIVGLSEDFAKKKVMEVLMDTSKRPWIENRSDLF